MFFQLSKRQSHSFFRVLFLKRRYVSTRNHIKKYHKIILEFFFVRFVKQLLYFLAIALVLVDGIILDCTYSVKKSWIEPLYHCEARIVAIGDEHFITEVSRNHLAGYNDVNVSSISFTDQVIRLPPRNIETFFPNVALYHLLRTQTEAIHPNDIKELPHLKYYLCQGNPKVTKIPPNMFANNGHLVGIAFNVNSKIQHVAYHVFDHLEKLTYLHIYGCIDLAVASRTAVAASLFKVFQACPPDLDMLNEQLSQRNCDCCFMCSNWK